MPPQQGRERAEASAPQQLSQRRELEILQDALRDHVKALAVDIGPRTPSSPDSLMRTANYIHSVFDDAELLVQEQNYEYYDQRVKNVLAMDPATAGVAAYYIVGAHYDTVPGTPGADDNASAVAVMLELARRLRHTDLKVPVLFSASSPFNKSSREPDLSVLGHLSGRNSSSLSCLLMTPSGH